MAIYVDAPAHAYGRMVMCHMFSPDLDELHAMADIIGVARKWFQDPRTMPKVSWPHYDIAKSKRAIAVASGAIECDKYQMVAMGAIIKNRYWNTDIFDPLKHSSGPFSGHVPQWLKEQGYV